MTLFEKATRKKIRFATELGNLSVEDLWDLPLENLDRVAQKLHKEVKEGEDESFITDAKPTLAFLETKTKFDVIKRVIEVRLIEKEAAEKAAKTRAKKAKALEELEKRQDRALEDLSDDELRELAGIEAEE